MKKKITTLLMTIILSGIMVAQPPQAFKYQAVVRNNTGEILQNQAVGIRISIHDVTAGGTIVYQETFSEITNDFGLVNLEIGKETPTIGIFIDIDWSSNSKFIETEIDPSNGTAYVSMGTSELLAVPYALFSDRSSLVSNKGTGNIYVGEDVANISSGHSNAFVGYQSGYSNTTGYVNSFLGYQSGYLNSTGAGNIFVGNSSGYTNTLGSLNTIIADRSGIENTEGNRNTYLGYKSGYQNTTGTGNVCIGYKAGHSNTGSNKLYIHNESNADPLIYGEFDNEILGINGSMGVCHNSPLGRLSVEARSGIQTLFSIQKGLVIKDGIFNVGNELEIQDYNGNTTMVFSDYGRLGIGDVSPQAALHIKGNDWPNSFLYLESDIDGDAGIRFYEGSDPKWHMFNNSTIDGFQIYNQNSSQLIFYANQSTGSVGIGTVNTATGYKLSVDGKLACEEVLVKNSDNWPDFVFLDNYDLLSLENLELQIKENNHLPGIPSAKEVEENGFHLADMQKKVLQKVEELTLYTIEQGKLIMKLEKRIEELENTKGN
ncbi:MAG: hypothetical protein K8R74_13085 [Bacteroidales bacterium]|nr:hypothetical protein [Bacteroidales bacterium]